MFLLDLVTYIVIKGRNILVIICKIKNVNLDSTYRHRTAISKLDNFVEKSRGFFLNAGS